MKVCVVGAGSIGGYVGVKLALAGEEVTLIARGPHLEAIKRDGLKLIMHDGAEHVAKDVKATRYMAEAGPQDVVILAVKAHQVEPIAEELRTLFGPETAMVTMQNGIPWWYFQKHGGEFDGRGLRTVDPNGVIARNIDPERIVGCVVYPAAEIEAPGVIRHMEGDRFPIGELDGKERERTRKISRMFVNAGFKSPILENIRAEIWLKLWGNMTFNPISALTHSTLVDICQHRDTRQLARFIMQEAQAVAGRLGVEFRVPLEKRIAGAEKVGKHKTSMLQDVEAGRYIEIDALAGSVVELGNLIDIPTPSTFAVYACSKLLGDLINHDRVCVRAQKLG